MSTPVRMVPAGVLPQAADQLGAPIGELVHATILDAVATGVEESEVLDFKRGLYPWQGSAGEKTAAKDELAKDVAAFANRRGGVLVLGVADRGDRADVAMPVAMAGRFDAWVRQTVAARVAPVAEVEVIELPDPDDPTLGFYVLVVLPSPRRPHAIYDPADDERAQRFPRRIGRQTQWLTVEQVRLELATQRQRDRERSIRAGEIVSGAARALGDRCWAVALVVPDTPGEYPITFEEQEALRRQQHQLDMLFNRARTPQTMRTVVGGIRQHSYAGSSGFEVGQVLIDRFDDGSSLVCFEIRTHDEDNHPERVGEIPMQYSLDALIWCLRTGFGHARRAGCYGTVTVACSFLWHGFNREVVWTTSGYHDDRHAAVGGPQIDGFLTDAGTPVTVPLPTTDDGVGTPLACRAALTPLVQRFGLPEVQLITEAGSIDPRFAGSVEQSRAAAQRLGWPLSAGGTS